MPPPKRRLWKWLLRLFLAGVALVVLLLLLHNTIVRLVMQHNLHRQTGTPVAIGSVHVGLTRPVIEIRDLKIYNPPGFGDAPFFDIAEIRLEYDRNAILKKEFHITLLRFNVAELDIVKSQDGRTNIFELGKITKAKSSLPSFKKLTGYDFTGIDSLQVSVGKAKYIDLQNPANNHEQDIALQNCQVPNVKAITDLTGLILLIDLRSNHFFDSLVADPQNSSVQDIFNILHQQKIF